MMVLMEIVIIIALIVFGACFGSFAGAQVWRLRAKELLAEEKQHERVNHKELALLKKLTGRSMREDRSRCLHCGETLRWYDLLPIVSWLSLGGRCRYCRKKIGKFELLIEVGMAAFFVASYLAWPFALVDALQISYFVLWLAAGVVMAMLFAYDAKWFLLPDRLTATLAVLGALSVIVLVLQSADPWAVVWNAAGAVGVLSGIYLVLYLISSGRWVGFGDIKLGLGLALLLGDWRVAFVALFLANFIGCLVVIPMLLSGKLKRTSRVPFGPLLIAGTVLAFFVGPTLLAVYLGTFI